MARDPRPDPLLTAPDLARLREALAGYTVDSVHEALGPIGRGAHSRGDLPGVTRALRDAPGDPRLLTLIRLFLLGRPVDEAAAADALRPLPLPAAAAAGIVHREAGTVRAGLEVRPYAEADLPTGAPWWVVSDLGSDVRPGPLPADHVLGIGAASTTLAQAVPRAPVGRALDIGTGSGVQALHLGRHARHVTATDVSTRALTLAATTAALSGQDWDLRQGSLLEPVAGERYDLVVANPPFVVSAGTGGYDYRDSGLAGDAVCETLLRGLPDILSPGGTAVLLANWIIPREGTWQDRVTGWLTGRGCDAWVWQRELADPGEYVSLWLRDAGEEPTSARWRELHDAWLDWFDAAGVAAIGMGMVSLRRTDAAPGREIVVAEDVPQAVEQPVGGYLADWFTRQRWLTATTDDGLLDTRLARAGTIVRTQDSLVDGDNGWDVRRDVIRQSGDMRWELEVDDAIAAVVSACDGSATLGVVLGVLAASLGMPAAPVTAAAVPVVRDLVSRGFLHPADGVER